MIDTQTKSYRIPDPNKNKDIKAYIQLSFL